MKVNLPEVRVQVTPAPARTAPAPAPGVLVQHGPAGLGAAARCRRRQPPARLGPAPHSWQREALSPAAPTASLLRCRCRSPGRRPAERHRGARGSAAAPGSSPAGPARTAPTRQAQTGGARGRFAFGRRRLSGVSRSGAPGRQNQAVDPGAARPQGGSAQPVPGQRQGVSRGPSPRFFPKPTGKHLQVRSCLSAFSCSALPYSIPSAPSHVSLCARGSLCLPWQWQRCPGAAVPG